ncbi:hypothetical protein Y695_00237 [Hydrogenophaga sp. T4]|nr:hypothetical protein Y695_00237 [Hydrogenophaga sp. T4]
MLRNILFLLTAPLAAYLVWRIFTYISLVLPYSLRTGLDISIEQFAEDVDSKKAHRFIRNDDESARWYAEAESNNLPMEQRDVWYISEPIRARNLSLKLAVTFFLAAIVGVIFLESSATPFDPIFEWGFTALIIFTTLSSIGFVLYAQRKHSQAVRTLNSWIAIGIDPQPYLKKVRTSIELTAIFPNLFDMDLKQGHAYYLGSRAGKSGMPATSNPFKDEIYRRFWRHGYDDNVRGSSKKSTS